MNKSMKLVFGGLLLLGLSGGAWAQPKSHPGYLNLDMAGLEDADVMVDVRLDGWLLGWARTAVAQSDDEDLAILSSIDSVRVRILRLDEQTFAARARQLLDQLGTDGWEEFARVREADHFVQVMVKGSESRIHGITVIAMESTEEAVFVNIAGRLDPADIAKILKNKDLMHADIDLNLGP